MAEQRVNRFLVDGQEVQLNAYVINGSNYLKLRDIGEAVGVPRLPGFGKAHDAQRINRKRKSPQSTSSPPVFQLHHQKRTSERILRSPLFILSFYSNGMENNSS